MDESLKEKALFAISTLNNAFDDASRRFWIEENSPEIEGVVLAMETEKHFWAVPFRTWDDLNKFLNGAIFVTL